MTAQNQKNNGMILTIEHPTDSAPALMVISGNAGQLLRGDIPTANILKAIRRRAQRNGVPFVMHFQEAGAMRRESVGMTRLIEDVFADDVTIYSYGPQESHGQIRPGFDQYIVSAKVLAVRARSVVLLPVVERNVLRRNQRAALNTSYDMTLPDGETAFLETTGFHYDLGLTPVSARISRIQAVETRRGAEQLLQQAIAQSGAAGASGEVRPPLGLKGLITYSGDGNTHGLIGSRWQMDRVEALKEGLGEDVHEATEEISVTANIPHSIQQEFIGRKHPMVKFAGNVLDDVFDAIDDTTGSKWGERKLDHQFYRDFTITPEGLLAPLQRFDVIENNVFYDFANADHYSISTLFGYRVL
jgi:hypothetical protein